MSGELVLVSGATGYLGAWVAKKCQEAGYRVRGTVRSLKNEQKVAFLRTMCPDAKYPIELVEADLLDAESWKGAVEGCEYVMHTASPYNLQTPKDPEEFIKPAVEGTLAVLRAAAEHRVKRVVVTSSFAANAERGDREGPYTEDDWSIPENQTSAYARSKTLAERAAWDFVNSLDEDKKFQLCTVQPVGIIGPALSANPAQSVDMVVDMMEGKVAAIPKLYFPLVDVRDCAEAHVKCLTVPEAAGKRFNSHNLTAYYPEVISYLAEEFNPQGYKVPTREVPGLVLMVLSWFNNDLKMLRATGEQPKQIDNTRVKTVLGVTPTPVRDSIVDMVYSLIELGKVHKADKYRGPPSS